MKLFSPTFEQPRSSRLLSLVVSRPRPAHRGRAALPLSLVKGLERTKAFDNDFFDGLIILLGCLVDMTETHHAPL